MKKESIKNSNQIEQSFLQIKHIRLRLMMLVQVKLETLGNMKSLIQLQNQESNFKYIDKWLVKIIMLKLKKLFQN